MIEEGLKTVQAKAENAALERCILQLMMIAVFKNPCQTNAAYVAMFPIEVFDYQTEKEATNKHPKTGVTGYNTP